jgi:predicted cupin superfamily sugar epimerase
MLAKDWIQHLNLLPHPEGGFYKELYRSGELIRKEHLPERFTGDRVFATSIYYLLEQGDFSAFHRIKQDEIWHHYDGGGLEVHIIKPGGEYLVKKAGKNITNGEEPQVIIEAGDIFGSRPIAGTNFALMGCGVAPGFDFDDFELNDRDGLLEEYPQHATIILQLTR